MLTASLRNNTNCARLLCAILLGLAACSCSRKGQEPADYFIGTNFWFAGRLAESEEGMLRLEKELDTLHALGIDNLRILAAEGEDADALERVLDAMARRKMKAVLYMNNAWEWSYGFGDYLQRAGFGQAPHPVRDGFRAYSDAMSRFILSADAMALNHDYIARLVTRLKGHDAIYSWQICNEPRPFSGSPESKEAFVEYIRSTARLIKSIDPDSMVSTGSEGLIGSENDIDLVRRINECPEVDYINIHIWPLNWAWVKTSTLEDDILVAIEKAGEYIDAHVDLARSLGKKLVIEEFGYPRDGYSFSRGSSVNSRNAFYSYIMERVCESRLAGDVLLGCNFWGWAGFAQPEHEWWQQGDCFTADPPHEPQGLYSVFATDSTTLELVRTWNEKLKN